MESLPPMPVIVGAGRSGTTLLRLMLDAHPLMSIPPETHFVPHVAGLSDEGGDARDRFLAAVTSFETWPDFAMTNETFSAALTRLASFSVAEGVRTFYRVYAQAHGKSRWGDKTPDYCLHLELLGRLLPEARFIHIIRDGRDVAVSIRPLHFSPGDTMEALARDWVHRVRTARAQAADVEHYREVRYEDLVTDPSGHLRAVAAYVDLPWDDVMLRYWRQAPDRLAEAQDRFHPVTGELVVSKAQRLANHEWTAHPPERSRVGRWREVLTPRETEEYLRVAADLLGELGYLDDEGTVV